MQSIQHTRGIHQYMAPRPKTQDIEEAEDSLYLSPKHVTRLHQLGGTLLYYARAAYPTLIMQVNVLASE
jgi:hypothetical protein